MAEINKTPNIDITFETEEQRNVFVKFWDDFQHEYYLMLPTNVRIDLKEKSLNSYLIKISEVKKSNINFKLLKDEQA